MVAALSTERHSKCAARSPIDEEHCATRVPGSCVRPNQTKRRIFTRMLSNLALSGLPTESRRFVGPSARLAPQKVEGNDTCRGVELWTQGDHLHG